MSDHEKFVVLAAKDDNFNSKSSKTETKQIYPKLENVKWNINITTANDQEPNVMIPHALIRLNLSNSTSHTTCKTTLDMNETECIKLFEILEEVQNKLDDVYKDKD